MQPPETLHTTVHSSLLIVFSYIVEPFKKATTQEYNYILAATGYFSKWVDIIAVRDFTTKAVVEYIRIHNIYRFRILETITVDNGKPFNSEAL